MLELKDLSYRYKGRTEYTLHHVFLSLEAGGMLLLAGRSGCGKSTLLKLISGLAAGTEEGSRSGTISWNGEDMTDWPPERIGLLAGTVYQTPDDQLFAMTVEDEVGFALENQGEDPDAIREKVGRILALTGLAGLEKRGIHQLSGGQRQRMALASVLITKPKLLLLDEPVSQMNPQGVRDFMDLLLRLNREEGIAILMVEHRVNELARYFSRLAVMQAGRIVYDGSMEKAWPFLTGKEDMGLREPQCVKLGRLLHLPRLTWDVTATTEEIRQHCDWNGSVRPVTDDGCAGSAAPLVEASHVYYCYPGMAEDVLKDISFTLRSGEITALMGFNGAGKSTLLNLLGGLTRPSSGSLLLDGRDIAGEGGNVGYLLQEPDLMLLADTVWEELKWKNKGLTDGEARHLLQRLHLEGMEEDFPLAISKGQRLRVVLGSFLARRPKLLLLDEPTTGQDEQSLREIEALLLQYRSEGGSILLCTHDVELAACIADQVLLLKEGRILAEGSAETVLSQRPLLTEGGLVAPPVLAVSEHLGIPSCITLKEVCRYVSPAIMGRR
ncbi:MAG: ABC transporter ATP-binding protein [Succiniclasticum sp.]